jgi:hypothetical protein
MEIVNICNKKFLGLTLDNTFSWKIHIDTVVPKLSSACYVIRTVKPYFVPGITEKDILFALDYDLWTNILGKLLS